MFRYYVPHPERAKIRKPPISQFLSRERSFQPSSKSSVSRTTAGGIFSGQKGKSQSKTEEVSSGRLDHIKSFKTQVKNDTTNGKQTAISSTYSKPKIDNVYVFPSLSGLSRPSWKTWKISGHYDLKRKKRTEAEEVSIGLSVSRKETGGKEKRKLEYPMEVQLFGRKASKNDTTKGKQISTSSRHSKPKIDRGYVCEICIESMNANELFTIKGCSHIYCKDCIVKYIATKLQENIPHIRCPVTTCQGRSLKPDNCCDILPEDVFDRWTIALCEDMIPGAQKFYCPFKDCSALLIDDGGEVIRESECPNCHRLFCAQCKVSWHAEIDCARFQKLNKGETEKQDVMLKKLADRKKWKRCPNCRYYVDRKNGCNSMKCRCGTGFCYRCGTAASNTNTVGFINCDQCRRRR